MILVNRSAAVVFRQSAKAAFEHGATSRFSVASARHVPVDSDCPAGRLIDDRDHAERIQHAPCRCCIPGRQVPGPLRKRCWRPPG